MKDLDGAHAHDDKAAKSGWPAFLVAFIAVALLAAFAAWHFGYVDRWLYLSSFESNGLAEQPPALTQAQVDATLSKIAGARRGTSVDYAYSLLDEADQEKYRILLQVFETRGESYYPTEDIDDLGRIMKCVLADHPELVYVKGADLNTIVNRGSGMVEKVIVSGSYTMTDEEAADAMRALDEAATACLAELPSDADDYETAKYIYDWLAENVSYDFEAASLSGENVGKEQSQTAVGALVQGKAVCGGYAGAFQYLMKRRGLTCVLVTGTARAELHAWCLAVLDGAFYYIDPTWGDPQYEYEGAFEGKSYVNYDYLNVTSQDMLATHKADTAFALPTCHAVDDNYYVREGLLFYGDEEERFGMAVAEALSQGAAFQGRAVDEEAYLELRDSLVESGRLALYLPLDSYRYSVNDDNRSIAVFG